MFPTEFFQPTRVQQSTSSQEKIQVNFSLLESFYHNLIEESIRPDVLDFFQIQDKIDVKEKFNKYEHHKIHIKTQDDLIEELIKKSLIFNIPNDINENKIIQGPSGSKITYFTISQSLKNTITANHNNHTSKSPSQLISIRQKHHIENLSQFIHENESIFFLIKGSLEIHKKTFFTNEQKTKYSSNNQSKVINRRQVNSVKDISKSSPFKCMNLQDPFEKQKQNHKINIDHKEWKKHLEIKQHSFFSLNNYKTLHQQRDKQTLKIIPKSVCILAKIQINPLFGKEYLKSKMNKFSIISSFLSSKKQHDPQKLHLIKQIIDSFEEQKIRRDIIISYQGRKNEKIYITGGDGEVQFSKNIYFNESENVKSFKNTQIVNFSGKTIIGAQSYLSQSKNLIDILKDHSIINLSKVRNLEKDEKQESQNYLRIRQIRELQKEVSPFPLKRQSKTIQNSLNNENGKIYFGKNQHVFMEVNLPKLNQSNFTIKVNSAFTTVYSIKLEKFEQLASQQVNRKLIKNHQPIYITLLKKSLQKLQSFQKKVQFQRAKKNEKFKAFTALAQIQETQRFPPQLKNQNAFNLSSTKLEFHHKKQLKGLKRNDLLLKQTATLDKKVQILSQNNQTKKDKKIMTENFKKKIENLIIQNLSQIKNFNSPQLQQAQKEKIMAQINEFYIGNIGQIVSNQRLNKEKLLLTLNEKALNEKGINSPQKDMSSREIIQKDMFVDASIFDPSKNKSIKINFLRKGHPCVKQANNFLKGVQIQGYTDTIKANISVKINETNKIKEQFIKIQSKCESCKCYDDLDSYRNLTSYNSARPGTSEHICSSHDVKYHTMKIGVNWKNKYSQGSKVESKTAYDPKSLHEKMHKMAQDQQPFERVYNKIKVLKQKSLQRFNFNEHLLKKGKNIKSRNQRKRSLPLFI